MTAETFSSMKNHFLLAMPGMQDPRFAHALIYVCEHNPDGAMGLTVNHPTDVTMDRVFDEFGLPCPEELRHKPLLAGGPVQMEKGFVLHATTPMHWESTLEISPQISLTASRDIIEAMANGQGPRDSFITLGYAGWGPGQLEREIADNAWLTLPADPAILFDTPFEQRAATTALRLGIDLSRLSGQAGHA